MSARQLALVVVASAALAAAAVPCARAESLVDTSGELGPEPDSKVREFEFQPPDPQGRLILNTDAKLTQGSIAIRVLDPSGKTLQDLRTSGWMTVRGSTIPLSGLPGTYRVQVSPQAAVGTWHVTVSAAPKIAAIVPLLVGYSGMILVGLVCALAWWARSRVQMRWFWVGAAIWAVGVALKFAWALPLNGPILGTLSRLLPHGAYVAAGSVYIGLLTGVFEIGVTLAAGLLWRRMARDAARGIAVGVGAGAFEAVLLGAAMLVTQAVALLGVGGGPATSPETAGIAPLTACLIGPTERLIAILCHTSSRALTLLGVATRRWSLFAWGFLLMTMLDGVAGWVYLSGNLGRFSMWWIELAIAPAAVASVPIILWCRRRWPAEEGATP